MGRLLRSYWLPALLATDAAEEELKVRAGFSHARV
jgi:hypothetical protein